MNSKYRILFAIIFTVIIGTLEIPNISAFDPAQESCDNFWIPLSIIIKYNFCEQKICVKTDAMSNACTEWRTP